MFKQLSIYPTTAYLCLNNYLSNNCITTEQMYEIITMKYCFTLKNLKISKVYLLEVNVILLKAARVELFDWIYEQNNHLSLLIAISTASYSLPPPQRDWGPPRQTVKVCHIKQKSLNEYV